MRAHPGQRQRPRGDAAPGRLGGQRLDRGEGLPTAEVAVGSRPEGHPGIRWVWLPGSILAGEPAARQRAVGDEGHVLVCRDGKDLQLRGWLQYVVLVLHQFEAGELEPVAGPECL